jgi:hypothetical protein
MRCSFCGADETHPAMVFFSSSLTSDLVCRLCVRNAAAALDGLDAGRVPPKQLPVPSSDTEERGRLLELREVAP